MRTLIYIPVIHSQADMGSLAADVRQRFEQAFGAAEWQRRASSVAALWEGLRERVLGLPLDWARTRIYQDGLPVCGRELDIVHDLAAQGSHNHRLLAELVARGATLMGTESGELMLAEYARVRRLLQAAQRGDGEGDGEGAGETLKAEGEVLLRRRDAFVAERIRTTLQEGETGLVFLGLLHRVDDLLGDAFAVCHLANGFVSGAAKPRDGEETDDGR